MAVITSISVMSCTTHASATTIIFRNKLRSVVLCVDRETEEDCAMFGFCHSQDANSTRHLVRLHFDFQMQTRVERTVPTYLQNGTGSRNPTEVTSSWQSIVTWNMGDGRRHRCFDVDDFNLSTSWDLSRDVRLVGLALLF